MNKYLLIAITMYSHTINNSIEPRGIIRLKQNQLIANMHLEQLDTIKTGVDINIGDSQGNTQLHRAVINNNYKKIKEILNNPYIDVNIKNKYNMTPLYIAAIKNNNQSVELLLKNNPELFTMDLHGMNAYTITTSNQIQDQINNFISQQPDNKSLNDSDSD